MYKEAISSEHKPKPNEQKIMARLRTEIELFLSTMSSCLNSASLCSFFSLIRCKNFVANYLKQRAKFKSRTSLWEKIRGMFKEYLIDSWDDLLKAIAYGRKAPIKLVPNTGGLAIFSSVVVVKNEKLGLCEDYGQCFMVSLGGYEFVRYLKKNF